LFRKPNVLRCPKQYFKADADQDHDRVGWGSVTGRGSPAEHCTAEFRDVVFVAKILRIRTRLAPGRAENNR